MAYVRPDAVILDQWSPLSHKSAIGDDKYRPQAWTLLAPSWVPDAERRRLNAYKLLTAYRTNVARAFLNQIDPDAQTERREYGDVELIVERIVSGVLGDRVDFAVDGADQVVPETPDLPPEPDPPDADATPIEKRVFEERSKRWNVEAEQALADWLSDWEEHPKLVERQDDLRAWADDEHLVAKLTEGEQYACGLGDAVYTLAWSSKKMRPVVRVFDPGFYFPVLGEDLTDYPSTVHLAWQFDQQGPDGRTTSYVHRLTWELKPCEPKMLPWSVDEDGTRQPATQTCVFTDATWSFGDLDGRKATDFDPAKATYAVTEDGVEAREVDLGIDFLPVVHIPSTPSSATHYGTSTVALVAQLFDDIGALDTDIQEAAGMAAGPAIALSGASMATDPNTGLPQQQTVQRSKVFEIPDAAGRMTVLDLSAGLKQLLEVRKELEDRLAVNSRVPPEVLGRMRVGQALSGVALALSFGPFAQTVEKMRLVRDEKYRLLLKFASRMFQLGGVFEPGTDLPARVVFGAYLPTDRSAQATQVTTLLAAKAISRSTAVQMLVEVGFEIDDATHEVDRIKQDATDEALQVAEALGSEQAAADWLGIDLPDPPPTAPLRGGASPFVPVPPGVAPPAPGQPPAPPVAPPAHPPAGEPGPSGVQPDVPPEK